jgi:ribosome-interacting GTPase 1
VFIICRASSLTLSPRISSRSTKRVRSEDQKSESHGDAGLIYHLHSKLARLRAQLLEPAPGAGSGGGTGFDVSKSGDARIALVGFPSVGKSTFLSKITKTKSEVAAYAFTTLTAIPGVLEYGGAEIQVLDLPGIIEGASEGKGRGRQVISAAKTSDLIVMVLDATKRAEQRAILERELESVGIRLNRDAPQVILLRGE